MLKQHHINIAAYCCTPFENETSNCLGLSLCDMHSTDYYQSFSLESWFTNFTQGSLYLRTKVAK